MRTHTLIFMALVAIAGLSGPTALAHHSTLALYNEDVRIELTGTVQEWRFINPHPSLIIEVTDADGEVQEWDVSYGGSAVTHLRRRGYTAETFTPGDQIVVSGFAAKADTAYGLLIQGDPVHADGSPVLPAAQ